MAWMLNVVITLGPLLGISKLIGKERTRALELSILRLGERVWFGSKRLMLAWFAIAASLLPVIAFAMLRDRLAGPDEHTRRATLVAYLWLGYGSTYSAQVAHRILKRAAAAWQNRVGRALPWPIDHGGRSFDGRLYLSNAILFDLALSLVIYPLIIAGLLFAYVILLPLVFAERLRSRLAPDSASYLDLIAYVISAVGVIVKLRT